MTTTPPVNEAGVASSSGAPLFFPHIADSGGYTTQFIFISANGAATVSVNFIGDDGTPLNIERN